MNLRRRWVRCSELIMTEYHLMKRQIVTVNELYSMSPTASYFYDRGWNRNAVIALALSGALSVGLAILGAYGSINVGDWLIGACAGAVAYKALCSYSPPAAELTLADVKQTRGATP
jgi:nucleobase:cation symporter-1, NCS1 family